MIKKKGFDNQITSIYFKHKTEDDSEMGPKEISKSMSDRALLFTIEVSLSGACKAKLGV